MCGSSQVVTLDQTILALFSKQAFDVRIIAAGVGIGNWNWKV